MAEDAKVTHTPGPWTVAPSSRASRGGNPPEIRQASTNYLLAEMVASEFMPIEANARLIAAAPDLLAACKDVDTWWGQIHGWAYRTHPDMGHAISDSFAALRAAIARAEGR